jgi:hypothetical protein
MYSGARLSYAGSCLTRVEDVRVVELACVLEPLHDVLDDLVDNLQGSQSPAEELVEVCLLRRVLTPSVANTKH